MRLFPRLISLCPIVVACGSRPPEPQAPPLSSHVEQHHRTTPAPIVSWRDGGFFTDALPAVARAGEVTVVAIRESDAGRGYPNLRIEVRDRADKTIQTIPIMTSNEFETLVPDETPSQGLRHRIDAATAELARLHGLHDLVPMHSLEIQKPPDEGLQDFAIGDGFDIQWNKDHVHVFRHNINEALTSRDGTKWLEKDHKPCPNCEVCENPAFLAGVFHATEINVLVVEIGYKGNDTCWEPCDQLHVFTW
jgi:hypothetical protein